MKISTSCNFLVLAQVQNILRHKETSFSSTTEVITAVHPAILTTDMRTFQIQAARETASWSDQWMRETEIVGRSRRRPWFPWQLNISTSQGLKTLSHSPYRLSCVLGRLSYALFVATPLNYLIISLTLVAPFIREIAEEFLNSYFCRVYCTPPFSLLQLTDPSRATGALGNKQKLAGTRSAKRQRLMHWYHSYDCNFRCDTVQIGI
jgi:hypothetical protein